MALIDDLLAADQAAEILHHVARATWAKAHDGAECPADCIPTWPVLVSWWVEHGSESVAREAREVLSNVLGDGAMWMGWPLGSDQPTDVRATHPRVIDVRKSGSVDIPFLDMAEVHRRWTKLPVPRPRHPLAPVIDAWQRRPVSVSVETRADRRIMPTWRISPTPERERGVLFGGLVEDRPRVADLPLFPELEPARHRVPLLEIVDATGVPLRSPGHGAPIEARLIVRGGLLMIRPEDRGRTTVRIAVTVRELLDGLYPPRNGKRRIAQYWPKIEAALRRARDFTVTDATGGRWFPLALRRLPAERPDGKPPALDDLVVLDLAPPPGATRGTSIDLPLLDEMGVTSGPAWYAYIAGRSLVWRPGTTRRPVPKAGDRWGWSRDPNNYPVLTLAALRRFAFGAADEKHRTRAEILEPWQGLPDVVFVPNQTDVRTGIRGYRLLPAEAAEAVRRLSASSVPMRGK